MAIGRVALSLIPPTGAQPLDLSTLLSDHGPLGSDPAISGLLRSVGGIKEDPPGSNMLVISAMDPRKAPQLLLLLRSRMNMVTRELGLPCGSILVLGADTYTCSGR